jgi:hypothetical protein
MTVLGRGLNEMLNHTARVPRGIFGAYEKEEANVAKKKEEAVEAKEAPAMHTEEIERNLECQLTKEDIEQRAAQTSLVNRDRLGELSKASSLRGKAATLRAQAKECVEEAKECQEEAERLMEEVNDLIDAVTDKVEKRQVKCRREYDYKADKVRVIRLDTNETVEEREMRSSERQMALGFELNQRGQGEDGYMDKRGRFLFVSDGISDGEEWGTFYRSETGSLKRFTGKGLDMRKERKQAEDDLRKYAEEHGFKYVDGGGEEKAAPAEKQDKVEDNDNEGEAA